MISLKNVKYSELASEETHYFQATIYVDGKKAGTASNEGHGGPTDIHWTDKNLRDKAEKWVDTLPTHTECYGESAHVYIKDTEWVIDDLVTDWLYERDCKRLMRTKILYTKRNTRGVWQTKGLKKAQMERLMAMPKPEVIQRYFKDANEVLNFLPVEKAVEIFRVHAK